MKEGLNLTEGSRIKINLMDDADKPLIMEGIFRGYVRIGDDYALHLELYDSAGTEGKRRKKTIRLIPVSVIKFIDVLRLAAEKKKEKKNKSEIDGTLYS